MPSSATPHGSHALRDWIASDDHRGSVAAAIDVPALPSHGDAGGAQLRTLQAVIRELVGVRTLDGVGILTSVAARSALRADVLLVATIDQVGRELRAAPTEATPAHAPVSIPLDGPSLVADVARTAEPVFLRSATDVLRGATRGMRELGCVALPPTRTSMAVLPLTGTDKPLGVIVLGRTIRGGFTFEERALMMALAGLCGLAVERLGRTARVHTELTLGSMRIDVDGLRVDVDERSADLTPSELRVLMVLAEEPGRTRTRREILQRLWRTENVHGERACDAHIWNLRRKIERDPSRPRLVVTRRGKGYALVIP